MSFAGRTTNLIDVLERRISSLADKTAFKFLLTDDRKDEITYHDFHRRVLSIASYLQQVLNLRANDRVLILYPPGLDYVYAVYGCVWAGVIAVPAYPPDYRNSERIISILKDCTPSVILAPEALVQKIQVILEGSSNTSFLQKRIFSVPVICSIDDRFHYPTVRGTDVAFLQYTSGSTAIPRGVVLTHANLLANVRSIVKAFSSNENSEIVSWAPPYHDMGLIGSIVYPFVTGMTSTMMSPLFFIKNPIRWLKTISDISATDHIITTAPNFGYELCCTRISDEMAAGLDLRNLKLALCGAEPIRFETYDRFCHKFEKARFKREAFIPVYGLAEATLLVSGGQSSVVTLFEAASMKENLVKPLGSEMLVEDATHHYSLVSCGMVADGLTVRIVIPDTRKVCAKDEVGEIWIKGESVAKQYWNNVSASDETFEAFTMDEEGPFLRTGDLGFFLGDQLYISGRLKDCIIISGQNHYPHDIENTISNLHALLRKDCTAVFSVDDFSSAYLRNVVAVQEVARNQNKPNYDEISQLIKREVFQKHSLAIWKIVFIEQSSIPKTSSGKIQRGRTRQLFLEDKLDVVAIG